MRSTALEEKVPVCREPRRHRRHGPADLLCDWQSRRLHQQFCGSRTISRRRKRSRLEAIPSRPTDFVIAAAWRASKGLVVVVAGPEGAGKSVGAQRAMVEIQKGRRATKVLLIDKTFGNDADTLGRHIADEIGMILEVKMEPSQRFAKISEELANRKVRLLVIDGFDDLSPDAQMALLELVSQSEARGHIVGLLALATRRTDNDKKRHDLRQPR
jgi:type II secretory pathway predicted ATPase ExeA